MAVDTCMGKSSMHIVAENVKRAKFNLMQSVKKVLKPIKDLAFENSQNKFYQYFSNQWPLCMDF